MGIFIHLDIMPARISREEWKKVYEETLLLVEEYHFMDMIIAERNGIQYSYSRKTQHRDNIFEQGYSGWNSVGDMRTGFNTENYALFSDIEAYYPETESPDKGTDILLYAYHDFEWEQGDYCCNIWGNKSQGKDSHVYLLAIGCLIADRFPHAAHCYGDISLGQCRKAIKWANQYLKTPIQLPVTANKEILMKRLKAAEILPKEKLLDAFLSLSLEGNGNEIGSFLQQELSDPEIYEYFRKVFSRFSITQMGFEDRYHQYMEMGFDFKNLCRILITDPEGSKCSPEEFLRFVIKSKLHKLEKETYDYTKHTSDKPESEEPDDISGLMARVMGRMMGARNHNVDAFYPLEFIKADCIEIFGDICDVESLLPSILDNTSEEKNSVQAMFYDDPNSSFSQFAKETEVSRLEKSEAYDIISYEDLIDFTPASKVEPQIDKCLMDNFKKIYTFGQEKFKKFCSFNREEREQWFLLRDEYLLLKEDVWNLIFERIMEDDYIRRFHALFHVDCSLQSGNELCEILFSNVGVIDYYWEKTGMEAAL